MFLLFPLLFASSVIASLPCGIRTSETPLQESNRHARAIIGGNEIDSGRWPWQILMMFNVDGRQYTCGGSVISDNWILTAAHCALKSHSNYAVFTGVTNTTHTGIERKFSVLQAYDHPDYDGLTNDIALLKLASSVSVPPICLPNKNQLILEANAVATGYDRGTNKLLEDLHLRETIIPLVEQGICEERYNKSRPDVQADWNKIICSGSMGHGAARGDSGGPLMMKASDGRWFEIGITSFGDNYNWLIKQDEVPGAFTDVRKYCDWIEKTTEGVVMCQQEEVTLEELRIEI